MLLYQDVPEFCVCIGVEKVKEKKEKWAAWTIAETWLDE